MNALKVMDRYWKVVIQVSTRKHDIKVQYLYDNVRALISMVITILDKKGKKCCCLNWQVSKKINLSNGSLMTSLFPSMLLLNTCSLFNMVLYIFRDQIFFIPRFSIFL